MPKEPVVVEVVRGQMVESSHRVHVCVTNLDGNLILRYGDETLPVFPRSAIKPIQALPLVESGAADAFGLTPFQLSLACASHNGEALHTNAVVAWLEQLGLSENSMVCAGHWSLRQHVLIEQVQNDKQVRQRHNNCSGKHCGLLTLAKHIGAPLHGYERPDHPVQQRLLGTLEAMTVTRLDMATAAGGWLWDSDNSSSARSFGVGFCELGGSERAAFSSQARHQTDLQRNLGSSAGNGGHRSAM